MSKIKKAYAKLISGQHDKNFKFAELWFILMKLGFEARQEGSHRVLSKEGSYLNIQPTGGFAKEYQIRQVRESLKKHGIEPK